MSTKDNSYSQLTKRLRSKYNASFYQNNNQRPINVFDSVTGDISNPWLNALVTGRKDVINTSDLGYRNVDPSCVCGAVAAAPAPAPLEGGAIYLMEGGSLYAVTTDNKLFKANNPDTNTLTKAYYVSLGSFTNFIPYILYVGDAHVYIVGYEIADPSKNYVIVRNKLTGASVATIEISQTGTTVIITGLNEIVNGSADNYLYVSYIKINETGPAIDSYIQLYDTTTFATYGSAVDLTAISPGLGPTLGTIVIGNVIAHSGSYYTFANVISAITLSSITYNVQATKWTNFDLTTISGHNDIILNAEISSTISPDDYRQTIRPLYYNDGADDIIALPTVISADGTPSPPITGLTIIKLNLGTYPSGNFLANVGPFYPTRISSPFVLGSYLYISGSVNAADNYIYGVQYESNLGAAFYSSTASALAATNYNITNDGTSYMYRWLKDGTTYYLEKYDGAAGGSMGTISPTITSSPIIPTGTLNYPVIAFNTSGDAVDNVYGNDSDATITKIVLTSMDFDPTVSINILF